MLGIDLATLRTCTRCTASGTPSRYKQSWLLRGRGAGGRSSVVRVQGVRALGGSV